MSSMNKVYLFFRTESLLDFMTIIFLLNDIYNDIFTLENNIEDKMLWLLLSLKTLKMRY